MRVDTQSGRTTVRYRRDDGDATKARLIDAAGPLFAERGFADVTSKEICERAKANIAAVNYHFGSREGLYQAVLQEMLDSFAAPSPMPSLRDAAIPPRRKLEMVLERLSGVLVDGGVWQVRLWAREWMSPSSLMPGVVPAHAMPYETLNELLGEITGIPAGDPALDFCLLPIVSLLALVTVSGPDTPLRSIRQAGAEAMAAHLKTLVFAGIDGFGAEYACGRVPGV